MEWDCIGYGIKKNRIIDVQKLYNIILERKIQNVDEIGSSETTIAARDLLEPKDVVDEVYCILYDDGKLTISQIEITPDENRTVLNKGYFTRPKDVDTTEGKQHIITVRFVGGVKPKSCSRWFGEWNKTNIDLSSCIHLTEIKNIENLYTNECTNMFSMFYNCKSLKTLNLGDNFDTSNVTTMYSMFYNCKSLTTLDVSNFDTSKITSMYYMFAYCCALTSLNLGDNFDTSKVTDMQYMFSYCPNLLLDCSSWNVSKVTNHTDFNKNSPNVISPIWKN